MATAQIALASSEYLYALSLRSIALRAHALVVASECLETISKVVSAVLRDKRADGNFSFGYGRCPVLLEYAGATILILVTCSLSLEAALRLKHHSGTA
jgi:Co/Zn/Cd efflux system component